MTSRASLLASLRLAVGDTQAAAAARVHVTTRTWERWEGGQREPPEAVVHLYALLTGQAYG